MQSANARESAPRTFRIAVGVVNLRAVMIPFLASFVLRPAPAVCVRATDRVFLPEASS